MRTFRFVHFSDIHFGQEKDGELIIDEDLRNEVVADCRTHARAAGAADGILVTGDIAYSGKIDQYRSAGDWLDRVAAAIGCDKTAVRPVPGNHDVNIDDIDPVAELVHAQIRASSAEDAANTLERVCRTEDGGAALKKLRHYRQFAEQYGCDFEAPKEPRWIKPLRVDNEHTLQFVGLTTVLVSDLTDTRGSLVIGPSQYVLPRVENTEYVVLLHHPLDWLKNRESAGSYLRSRARVILMGHEHAAAAEKITDERGGEHIVIRAGAVVPANGEEPSAAYTYNWIEVGCERNGDNYDLHVTVQPRIWYFGATQFVADTIRAPNGVISLVARAPEFQVPMPAHAPPQAPTPQPIPIESATDEEGLVPMDSPDDAAYAKLRYFFWRYLGWRERLKVLVQLDILPEGSDSPVPQVLERMALQKAIAEGKLGRLWDAVMPFVPEAAREPNPYTKRATHDQTLV